ncbi:glycogen synthase GlgA [Paraburkholderia phenoliruptrix]|uniref:glycogen synthase GlgA n=1 Tax=Paraburkholderia phenoliruptrix TaxID=252970 RepID=UPI001C6DF903|nr:glycogen synthase GlgA [Paraburkholderia phenoliruptrix]MBW9102193.1 glycogen synthase GlgA [Paraburkholderia phenoliruptrix]MBW9131304.1 glycogen synthase GlgA [Paraburkholderia ginsengiterrae]
MPLNVLLVASEALPLAKSGGLGDMVSAYASALRDAGVDVSILMPAYPAALEKAVDVAPVARMTGLPGGDARLLRGRMPDSGVTVLLLQMDHLFAREGLYRDPQGRDYLDNLTRFASLAAAATRVARGVRNLKRPDIVHAHDWHAGLTPLYMRLAGVAAKSVFTIHNLAFQGNHPLAMGGWIGVPPELLVPALTDERSIEFYGSLSMMKAGIVHADRVTTVSQRYAREILTPRFGHGMEGVLQAQAAKLSGIVNGIDTSVWNPATDAYIARPYSVDDTAGKQACKRELQQACGLTRDPFAPLVAIGSRLTEQKLADVVIRALPVLLERHPRLQFAILGQGERALEHAMQELAAAWPGRVGVQIGYDERRAHMLHAGADILLHGSRFEPCGLTQLYAMRYGTIPVASRVGGLADTIVDYAPECARGEDCATGFLFDGEDTYDVVQALGRALAAFMRPSSWHALQRNAMSRDSSWEASTSSYLALYADLVDARPALRDTRVRKTPGRARTAGSAAARQVHRDEAFGAGVGEMVRSA